MVDLISGGLILDYIRGVEGLNCLMKQVRESVSDSLDCAISYMDG